MIAEEVKNLLIQSFPDASIKVKGDEANFSVDIVSQHFENVTRFNRQKKVLACVKEQITSGEIHAFSIQAFTQEEWEKEKNTLVVL